MASIPLDVGAILAEAAEPNGGADPGTVMGHVHLKVSDLERSIAFYRDVLGLGLRAQLGPQAAFLAAGDYHHHIGINVWHSRGGGPPPPGSAGLAWFALELPRPRRWPRRPVRCARRAEVRRVRRRSPSAIRTGSPSVCAPERAAGWSFCTRFRPHLSRSCAGVRNRGAADRQRTAGQ